MRRILLVFSVAALMVAMVVVMAVPAFAAAGGNGGGHGRGYHLGGTFTPTEPQGWCANGAGFYDPDKCPTK